MANGYGNTDTASKIVLDTSPMLNVMQDNINYNRKVNAEKAAKRATGIAKLNAMKAKMDTDVWSKDVKHSNQMVSELEDWMVKNYSEGGESAIYDSPKLTNEFESRLRNINDFSKTSRKQRENFEKDELWASHNVDDLDNESVIEKQKWMDLPSSERAMTPMPYSRQIEMSLSETVDKYGKNQLEAMAKNIGYSTKLNPKTGEYYEVKGEGVNEEELTKTVSAINTNPASRIYKKAQKEALEDFDYEVASPTIIIDGVEQPNPEFEKLISEARYKSIEDDFRSKLKKYTTSSRRGTKTGGTDAEPKPIVVKVTGDQSGYTTKESKSKALKNASETYLDDKGNKFYKTTKRMYKVPGGIARTEEYLEKKGIPFNEEDVIPIGQIVDIKGNIRPTDEGLTTQTKTTKEKATREYETPELGEKKMVSISTYYSEDGTAKQTKEATAEEVQFVGNVNVKGEDRAKIMNKSGEVLIIPATKAIKEIFSDEYNEIDRLELEELNTTQDNEGFIDIN